MQASFWERDAMLAADFIVVGAGLIGLQTALELRQRRPQARIIVLERGALPAGASSRNAGFACFGSLSEILHDFDTIGETAALALIERRRRGLERLRRRLGDAAIGYEGLGGFELLFDAQLPVLQRLDEVNGKLRALFGQEVFAVDGAALQASSFGAQVKALVRNPLEGQLHSGRLMRALATLAAQQGIAIHSGVAVQALDESDGEVRVHAGELTFCAARVALCTNGFTRDLLPQAGIVPGRGQVLVTEPVRGLPWRGTYHFEQGFYYFRNVGERVLFGGGRHLDIEAETTAEMVPSAAIQNALERLLHETILPGRSFRIEQRWAGVMGFSADRKPQVCAVSERVVLGFGCNGMGVALSPEIAAETAALLLQATHPTIL